MNRLARILFPSVAAVGLMFTILAITLTTTPALADDPPVQTQPTGPCSDTPCSGSSTCLGDDVICPKEDIGECTGCDFEDAIGVPGQVCACQPPTGGEPITP